MRTVLHQGHPRDLRAVIIPMSAKKWWRWDIGYFEAGVFQADVENGTRIYRDTGCSTSGQVRGEEKAKREAKAALEKVRIAYAELERETSVID